MSKITPSQTEDSTCKGSAQRPVSKMSEIPSPSSPLFPTLFFFLYSTLPLFVFPQHINQEKAILLKLKQQWNNPAPMKSWNASNQPDHCQWLRVGCTKGSVTELSFNDMNIAAKIPPFICELENLTIFDISYNRIPGAFPIVFYNCSKLQRLHLSWNHFTGPFFIDKLPRNLSHLAMDHNRFSGRLPSNIVVLANLSFFSASDNLFSGEIPVEFTALSRLTYLSLARNRLSGQIPARIISWVSLETLILSRNQLSGEIPSGIGLLPNLHELDLSNNELSGHIPPEIGHLRLTFINLSSNQLSGRLPAELDISVYAYEESFLDNRWLCTKKLGSKCNAELRDSKRLSTRLLRMILTLSGVVLLVIVLSTFTAVRLYRKRKHGEDRSAYTLTSFHNVDFTEATILSNLTENNLIGSGGSGKVYLVDINHVSSKYVAVKMIWSKGKLEKKLEKEFLAEVSILGTIRHINIVKLLGYISNGKSHFLVYEYTENLSLDRWLHVRRMGSLASSAVHHTVLDWPRRMQIAVGAAQGLAYMHHSCSPSIIHRDVKSSNILLDSEFNAKIADFGLARILAKAEETDTMSAIAGSFGYLAPEYAYTSRGNEKIDVYSFGVVLLELVTGREATEGDEHTNLAQWSWRHFQDGKTIESALDEDAKDPCYMEEMIMVFKLGLMCTGTLPLTRPSMREVLQILQRNIS